MADTQGAAANNYVDLSVGRIQGDFDTQVSSSLNSITAVVGHYFSINKETDNKGLGKLEASVAFSYLDLSTEGLSNETGMGDVIAKIGATLHRNGLTLYPALAIKLPTADENKQLGSGEVDLGGFLSITHPCGAFICGVGLGYILLGDPPGTDYNDILRLNLNGFRRFGRLGVGAFLQQDTADVDGAKNPLSAGLNAFYIFTPRNALYSEISSGLNNTAADTSFRLGMVQWF